MVADGRYVADINGRNIKSYHGEFDTVYRDVFDVISECDPDNKILNISLKEFKSIIKLEGFTFKDGLFTLSCYRGDSSWWLGIDVKGV